MATEPKGPNGPKIEFDALAEKVVPDPATIPDSVSRSPDSWAESQRTERSGFM